MNRFTFRYRAMPGWPPLAWVACARPGAPTLEVRHGPAVERRRDWFCEAAWPHEFEAGGLDRTDLVFGSGARIRPGYVCFVSSGSTVDRLCWLRREGRTWVSNSLPGLLAAAGVPPVRDHAGYARELATIIDGLSGYRRRLKVANGASVRLTYFENLCWDGRALTPEDKPNRDRRFDSFEEYRRFLDDALAGLGSNLSDPGRRRTYRYLGTISSGYDSAAILALARAHGADEAIHFRESRDGLPEPVGAIADALDVRPLAFGRDDWRSAAAAGPAAPPGSAASSGPPTPTDAARPPEALFLAADGNGEDIYFHAAADRLEGRVLLTGFHGDVVWARSRALETDDLRRQDRSGLSLTEYRLWAGFLHCPVPFMGARALRSIRVISRSPEMAPWDVGGGYSRPIPRRILEQAGVPRDAFGRRKQACSVLLLEDESAWTPDGLAAYRSWLGARPARRRTGSLTGAVAAAGWRMLDRPGVMSRVRKVVGALVPGVRAARRLKALARGHPELRWCFPWAVEELRRSYGRVPPRVESAPEPEPVGHRQP